jgi:hypothetical protein
MSSKSRVVLVAPSYDYLTGHLARWLTEIGEKYITIYDCTLLVGDDANRHTLTNLIDQRDDALILVFFGHGARNGFLCEPGRGETIESDHDLLCSGDDFVRLETIEILAYCCYASLQFGEQVRSRGLNTFLGYKGEIWFYFTREEAFKRVVCIAVEQALAAREISPRSLEVLRLAYRAEHTKWFAGEYSHEPDAMFVCMCLQRHLKLLDTEV